MLIPIVIGLVAGGAAIAAALKFMKPGFITTNSITTHDKGKIMNFLPAIDEWPIVESEGIQWRVAPKYIPHVGIQEAFEMAQANGVELPNKKLVDAIWQAADVKIEPQQPRLVKFDFQEMNSDATVAEHAAKNEKQIAGRPFKLLAGTHKDVVRDMHNGRLVNGIYGWHRLNPPNTGKIIQDFPSAHIQGNAVTSDHKDYSQGLRMVKRV